MKMLMVACHIHSPRFIGNRDNELVVDEVCGAGVVFHRVPYVNISTFPFKFRPGIFTHLIRSVRILKLGHPAHENAQEILEASRIFIRTLAVMSREIGFCPFRGNRRHRVLCCSGYRLNTSPSWLVVPSASREHKTIG